MSFAKRMHISSPKPVPIASKPRVSPRMMRKTSRRKRLLHSSRSRRRKL